ncbi:hypothetical protein GCM10010246_18210 [Streptomyces cuspidosporus]|uniref:Uncharacterized protein n=1 Tax=Streptomyces cuspidosporus TaxID=66882 RepID=A0ABN3FPA5_9ACTN
MGERPRRINRRGRLRLNLTAPGAHNPRGGTPWPKLGRLTARSGGFLYAATAPLLRAPCASKD